MDQHTSTEITSKNEPKKTSEFRPDLQGVRAIAVLLVVLFHAKMPFLTGGYIGVDIFYVLSGYFITGILLRELQNNGKISIRNFYARRIRRILPASSLVLCVTALLAFFFVSPLLLKNLAVSIAAADFFSVNFVFAKDSIDYLAENVNYSPILHYWSLSVEEQFYILFPTFLIVLTKISQRLKKSFVTPTGLIGIAVASFVASIYLTKIIQPWAFFLLPSRAWELLSGALIAVLAPKLKKFDSKTSSALQIVGLGLITWSTFGLNAGSSFPGYLAAIPVVGTTLIILATPQGAVATKLMSSSVAQAIGRWSFSLYLWHWPLLTISWIYFGSNSLVINASIVVLSFLLAALTYHYWENPIRINQYWTKTKHRMRNITVVAFLTPVLCAGLLIVKYDTVHAKSSPVTPIAESQLHLAIASGLTAKGIPSNLSPALGQAIHDLPKTYSDGCHVKGFDNVEMKPCIFGNHASTKSMWLLGDSHAAQWFPALDAIATNDNIKFVALTKSSCPTVLTDIPSPVNKNENYGPCLTFNKSVLERVNREKPDLIVISGRHTLVSQAHHDGLLKYLQALPKSSQVVYLEDTPNPDTNIPQCLTTPIKSRSACNFSLDATEVQHTKGIKDQVIRSGRHYIPIDSWLCINNQCPVVAENVLMYRDDSHISTSASYWLSAVLKNHLDAIH